MRKNVLLILSSFLMITIVFTSCKKDTEELFQKVDQQSSDLISNGDIIPGQFIVYQSNNKSLVNFNGVKDYSERQEIMRNEIQKVFGKKSINEDAIQNVYCKAIYGFSGKLTEDEINSFKNAGYAVEPDRIMILKKPDGVGNGGGGGTTGQEIPWGITRVNGGTTTANGTAWIIDSGIDLDHPDLNVDASRSVTFVPRSKGPDDENGHGTHVAGTIAAIDNDLGVVGVAPGATVVAVRVLDRKGSGAYSDVIAGVDYVGNNGSTGDVANMSLGGPVSQALDDAVLNASNASGVKFCLAAGNESTDANNSSPSRVNGSKIYTISAMDNSDVWAYFSNYGNPPVDYCAPGINILSTWKGGGYNTISGTSMATPHAAGVLLLGSARTDGTVINDPDGHSDPIIVH